MTSASFFMAQHKLSSGWFYFYRHLMHLILALGVGFVIYLVPVINWQRVAPLALIGVLVMLGLVLVPGLGRSVNGASRWLSILGFNIQVSELAKVGVILYLSSYISRRQYEIQNEISGFLIPLVLCGLVGGLVLLEPDFGGLFMILMITACMLFFSGVPWRYILLLTLVSTLVLAILAFAAPYRVARLTSFFDPWSNPYGSSYQLTQSLMAIGRGGFWGVGLGQGLQKQLYLPEAHTDFIYAVIAEETGLFGCYILIACYIILFARMFYWVIRACYQDRIFYASYIFGLMVWWVCASSFSMAVNLGLVPTKGIALPLIGYGGSNLLVNVCAFAIFLRMTRDLQRDVICSY